MLYSKYTRSHTDESYFKWEEFIMPRPKGSKNKPKTGVTAAAKKTNKNYEALLAEKTAEKEQLTAEIAALNADLDRLKAQIKTKKAAWKAADTQIAKAAAKKAAAEEKAAAEARKVEVSSVLDKLLAGGMTADQILEKLQ